MSPRDWVELAVLGAGLLALVLPKLGVSESSMLVATLKGVSAAGHGPTGVRVLEALAGAGTRPADQLRAVISAVEDGDHGPTKAAIAVEASAIGVQVALDKVVQTVTAPKA